MEVVAGLRETADDQITPTDQSIRMFERARMPTELYLIAGESDVPLSGDGKPTRDIIKGCFDRPFPLQA